MKNTRVFFLIGVLIFPVATSAANINETVFNTSGTLLLANALQIAGLAEMFSDPSLNVTVFAPSDQSLLSALGTLGLSQLDLVANAQRMAPILLYHVVAPALNTSVLSAAGVQAYPNALGVFRDIGSFLKVDPSNSTSIKVVSVGSDARILTPNVIADNSIIHVIDGVLLPFYPSVSAAVARIPNLTTLFDLVAEDAPNLLTERFGPNRELTLFAPINSAFETFQTANSTVLAQLGQNPLGVYYLLGYHVANEVIFNATEATVAGTKTVTTLTGLKLTLVRSGNSTIVVFPTGNATIVDSYQVGFRNNGSHRAAVHVIDQVLIPPAYNTIADALRARGGATIFLTTLNSSSTYSGLLAGGAFKGTILVPTDSAFVEFLANRSLTASALQAATNLKQLLDAHIIKDTVISMSNINSATLTTASGAKITVERAVSGDVTFKTENNVVATAQYEYFFASAGNTTVIIIDAVLFNGYLTSDVGAASLPGPSPIAMLLCSLLAATLLYIFGRH